MQKVTFVLGKGLGAVPLEETLVASDSASIPYALPISIHGELVVVNYHIFTKIKLPYLPLAVTTRTIRGFFTFFADSSGLPKGRGEPSETF